MKEFWRKHWQTLLNLLLFACIGVYAANKTVSAYVSGEFDLVEIAFALHNTVFLIIILIRRQHQAVNTNLFHQGIALVAFFSGMLFQETVTPSLILLRISQVIIVVAWLLGVATLINLGRSFGILIAKRDIKTSGLYGVIRHPMYFTDILWRVGIIIKNPCLINFVVFAASCACYIYRAVLEERFLRRYPEYQEYMQRVKYRFLPGLF